MTESNTNVKFFNLTADEVWRIYLTEGPEGVLSAAPAMLRFFMRASNAFNRVIPSDPRCIWCHAPFHGLGAPLMKALGRGQSTFNPSICRDCENMVRTYHGGAEVETAILFADIRGSTTLAEKIPPAEFRALIDRFFRASTDVLVRANGFIDKLIGDEVTAFFVPGMAGHHYARHALHAGLEILHATGHAESGGPWVPVGVGIHFGNAYVGAVGSQSGSSDLTILGDAANTAARLASQAKAGEVLVSSALATAAGLNTQNLTARRLELKGRSEPVETYSLTVAPPPQ
jgi:adenylate cyclase